MTGAGCPCDLAGLGVLVTRPAHQSEALCRRIAACGGRPLAFPAMAIRGPAEPGPAADLLYRTWDIVIYTSANAVQFAAALVFKLPRAGQVAAVGRATARALAHTDSPATLLPDSPDSEGLLQLPALRQVDGQRVLIVRGEGGRTLLADRLRQRGASVAFAEVYRRTLPAADPAALLRRWTADVQAVTATSAEILHNLWQLLGPDGQARLRATPLVLISERMEPLARDLGIARTIRAAGAGEDALLTALCRLMEPEHAGQ